MGVWLLFKSKVENCNLIKCALNVLLCEFTYATRGYMNKRILFYLPKMPLGGVTIFTHELLNKLNDNNVDVLLVTNNPVNEKNAGSVQKVIFGDLSILLTILESRDFDILHLPSQSIDDGLGFIKMLFPDISISVTCHGSMPVGWSAKNCDLMSSCADWLSEKASIITGVYCKSIYNGVDKNVFNYNRTFKTLDKTLVWVGRVSDPIKNFKLFVSITNKLKNAGVKFSVVTSELQEDFQQQNSQLDLSNINTWSYLSRDELAMYFRSVAESNGSLIMTSLREGLPLVAIESQMCGCPVIAPCHTGLQEVGLKEDLIYPENLSEENIVNFIRNIVNDQKLEKLNKKDLSQRAIMKFSSDKMVENYISHFNSNVNYVLKKNSNIKRIAFRVKYENFKFRFNVSKAFYCSLEEYQKNRSAIEKFFLYCSLVFYVLFLVV